MRRCYLTGALVLAAIAGALVATQGHAYAGSFYCDNARGYFTARYNVTNPPVCARQNLLPQPALMNINKVDGSQDFMNIVKGALYSSDQYLQISGAFIVDAMLGYKGALHGNPAGGYTAAGISYAKNNWGTWVALVNSYEAANADPNSPYKVYWNYNVSKQEFCGDGTNPDSGYDWNIQDAVFYNLPPWWSSGCDIYPTGNVVVRFQWPGGKFDIDKPCGNLSGTLDKIPVAPQNHPPTGTISIKCTDPGVGQQKATVTFGDTDGATTGYIKLGSWQSATYNSPGPVTIPLPVPPTTDPYGGQTVTLYAKDVGPAANQSYIQVASGQTQVCAQFTCGSLTTNPGRIDPYMQFSLTVAFQNSVNQAPPGGNFSITVTPPAGATYTYSGSQAAGGSGGVSTATFNGVGPTNKAGRYTVTWVFTAPGINQSCPGSFDVAYMPYLLIFGGDVFAGAGPAYNGGATTCATNASAGVFSWNNRTSNSGGYSGAGTQYAVQALGQIEDFASALGSTNTAPTGLSFANYYNPVNTAQLDATNGLFGGNLASIGLDYPRSCDFTSNIGTAPVNANTTIAGHSVGTGTQETHYITGHDVYISGNIAYAGTGGWASTDQIPYFKLVVAGGDIFIDSSVTQLDGLYVAEASGATGGHIYTCASNVGGIWSAVSPIAAGYYGACSQKLIINGAFAAKQVQFLRTYGSMAQAAPGATVSSTHAGEVFNYTPELWLPRGGAPAAGYTAITGLPPVL